MGRRGLGHQPADERRLTRPTTGGRVQSVVRAPACASARFRTALDARHRRMLPAWLAPVSTALRRISAPVRIDTRVHIDARTSIVRQVLQQRNGADAAPRHQSATVPGPVVARLASRAERIDSAWAPSRAPRHVDETAGPNPHLRRAVPSVIGTVAPPDIVLSRATAPVPRAVTSAASTVGWGDAPAPGHGAHQQRPAAPDDRLPHMDVNHLTSRVIAAIEYRMAAARERLRE